MNRDHLPGCRRCHDLAYAEIATSLSMSFRIIPAVLGSVLVVGAWLAQATEDQQPAQPTGAAIADIPIGPASEQTVVRKVVYGLESEGNGLYLTSQRLDGPDWSAKRTKLEFQPKTGKIIAVSLRRMSEKNLVAAVKIRDGNLFHFHCLTLIGPSGGGHVRDRHSFYESKLLSTRINYQIVALDGSAGTASVILGQRRNPESGMISDGVMFFSGCPWPPDGELGIFEVTRMPVVGASCVAGGRGRRSARDLADGEPAKGFARG